LLNFKLANIIEDRKILEAARLTAEKIIHEDAKLSTPQNSCLREFMESEKGKTAWSKIS
jgi:ATP-dependent DNA helicase RecG